MTQKLREILQSVLLNIKADGLCNLDESCGCGLDDLAPCGNCNLDECEPAKWIKPEDGNPMVLEEFPEGYYSPLKKQAARIQGLEEALVEERANKMIQADDCTQNQDAADFHHRCICEYNVKKCPIEQWWLDRARITLQAEGKIGPDAKPRSWQITDERKATLSASLKVLERLKKNNTDTDHSYLDRGITVLRAMLGGAE